MSSNLSPALESSILVDGHPVVALTKDVWEYFRCYMFDVADRSWFTFDPIMHFPSSGHKLGNITVNMARLTLTPNSTYVPLSADSHSRAFLVITDKVLRGLANFVTVKIGRNDLNMQVYRVIPLSAFPVKTTAAGVRLVGLLLVDKRYEWSIQVVPFIDNTENMSLSDFVSELFDKASIRGADSVTEAIGNFGSTLKIAFPNTTEAAKQLSIAHMLSFIAHATGIHIAYDHTEDKLRGKSIVEYIPENEPSGELFMSAIVGGLGHQLWIEGSAGSDEQTFGYDTTFTNFLATQKYIVHLNAADKSRTVEVNTSDIDLSHIIGDARPSGQAELHLAWSTGWLRLGTTDVNMFAHHLIETYAAKAVLNTKYRVHIACPGTRLLPITAQIVPLRQYICLGHADAWHKWESLENITDLAGLLPFTLYISERHD